MRIWPLALLTAIGLFAQTASLHAQSRARFKIHDVQLGMPAGPFSSETDEDGRKRPLYKAGQWAPVQVEIECLGAFDGRLKLVVETADSDDLLNSYSVPFPAMQPGERINFGELPYLLYTKAGSFAAGITVSLQNAETGQNVCEPFQKTFYGSEPDKFHILTAAARMPAMRFSQPNERPGQEITEPEQLEFGRIEVASIESVPLLPDRWFGYSSIDLMILTTGSDEGQFVTDLFGGAHKPRANALREWVRRGGHLVISVGSNTGTIAGIGDLTELFPGTIQADNRLTAPSLKLIWQPDRQVRQDHTMRSSADGKSPVYFTTIAAKPGRSSLVLMEGDENTPWAGQALIRTGPYGLGKVTVVGFDLEKPPFTDWKEAKPFWEWLVTEAGGRLPSGSDRQRNANARFSSTENTDSQLEQLQGTLDFFEGVPVVSFGWVALFILLYILIIGPLDYYLLKKVFKRMELTWVTFPIVVLTISAIAYFTAYAIKGEDLRVNKIDLVDVDLQTNRCYGQSWFTIFSPRIQSYNVAIEPNGDGWSSGPLDTKVAGTVVSWLGQAQGNRQSLFRRSYRYHVDPSKPEGEQQFATGLESVPIQVWSTKAFSAQWSTPIDAAKPPLTSTLRLPNDRADLPIGGVTLNLPVERLDNVQLFYRDERFDLGTLVPGVEKRFVGNQPLPIRDWLSTELGPTANYNRFDYRYRSGNSPIPFRLWGILFHDRAYESSGNATNASLRDLDQSWRLRKLNTREAILIARIPNSAGSAEEQMSSRISPTRLWLSELPDPSVERTPVPGTLRQETYIRVLIPIPVQP